MGYGIGLDIGITSIGWVTTSLDENEAPYKIDKLGCRIFDLAENPKDGSSLAKPRREARSARRRLRRHRHRLERIRQLITQSELLSEEKLLSLYDQPVSDIYAVRSEALDRILSDEEFARVLIHIAQRRGFKSNRKSDTNEKEAGKLLAAISANEAQMAEKGYRTVGEMLYKDPLFAACKRNKGENYLNTASRSMIEEEVKIIFQKQTQFGQSHATEELRDCYINILLSQRSFEDGPGVPSPYAGNQIEKMIGHCVFEPSELRSAKAEYDTQYAVLLENVNHLRIGSHGTNRALTESERSIVIQSAFSSASLSYFKLRKALGLSEDEFFTVLSYGDKSSEEVEKKAKFEYLRAYHQIKNALEKAGKGLIGNLSHDELDDIGYALTVYKSGDKLADYLGKKGINPDIADVVIGIPAFSGFGRLSRKACRKIIPYLEQGIKYNEACEAAGYSFRGHEGNEKSFLLPAQTPEFEDITNPVVRRAISQTIKVVNAIIREHGESPTYLNVELARELSKDHDERFQIEKENTENREKNEKIMERLHTEFGVTSPTGQDLIKFKLWTEQDGVCPYSLEHVDIERLFEPGYADIDHIIPYSISFDDSYRNKVLVKSAENRQKGNRLPMQYLSGEKKDRFIVWVNTNIRDYKKRQKLLKEQITEEDENQFIERNLNDTKYISRFVLNYIRDNLTFADSSTGMKKRVRSVNGAITAYLRKRWGINKVRENGDAHHIVDAAVIACVTDGTIKKVTEYSRSKELAYVRGNKTEEDSVVNIYTGEVIAGFPAPWKNYRKEILIRCESIRPADMIREAGLFNYTEDDLASVVPVFISRMPKHKVTGAAHKDTVKSPKVMDEGYVITRRPLSALKLDQNGEIENYYRPESDRLLYEALKVRLNEFHGDGSKAFKDNSIKFYKPTSDGKPGHEVKKVKLLEKVTMNVPVYGGNGVADNDSMVRIDVFYVKNDGYYWVPVYIADTLKESLPNSAVVAHKPYENWKEMKDEDFLFSLYPNDLIHIKGEKPYLFKQISKESTLPKEKQDNDCFVYYISGGISGGSITVINHDKTYTIASLGVKTLISLEKYQVDVLGNYSKVGKEKRMGFHK